MQTNNILKGLEEKPWEIIREAGRIREEKFGQTVDACSIINARSGNCSEDCAFCAQSAHHGAQVRTYPLVSEDTVIAAASHAFDKGVKRFCIVTSGRGINSNKELSAIARMVGKVRETGFLPCATLGSLTLSQLRTLKEAGLHRYHHNLETSKGFFPRICSTHTYDERIETLSAAKDAGLSTCSGGIFGMGEGILDRAQMASELARLDVDSVPLNFLMPIPGTPLENADLITPLEALKSIALFRHILPDKEIRICAGRLTALKDLHPMIFMAGANGILMGDYLTTSGRNFDHDLRMINDLGMRLHG
ncbi:MAG: biotin synthase BioB [Nitrospirota bacterium]